MSWPSPPPPLKPRTGYRTKAAASMTICRDCKHMRKLTNKDFPELPQDDPCCVHPDTVEGKTNPVTGMGEWDRILCESINKGSCTLFEGWPSLDPNPSRQPTPIRKPPFDRVSGRAEEPDDPDEFVDYYDKGSGPGYGAVFWVSTILSLAAGAASVVTLLG